jgi:hypothetical protein
MKRVVILTLLLVWNLNLSYAQYLVRFVFEYKLLAGHYEELYYSVNNLNELHLVLSNVDTVEEYNISKQLGTLLDPDNVGEENCIVPVSINVNFVDIFKTKQKKTIELNNDFIKVRIEIVKSHYQLCIFPIYNKRFTGNPGFKQMGVLKSAPIFLQFNKYERNILRCMRGDINQWRYLPVKFGDKIW